MGCIWKGHMNSIPSLVVYEEEVGKGNEKA